VYTVQFLASCVALFWTPAKDATVPNLVPPDKLEQANGYSLFTTYGTALPAGLVFSLLAPVAHALGPASQFTSQVNLALYFNAGTFAVSAVAVFSLRMIARQQDRERISAPAVARIIWEGWRFVGQTGVVRGIVIGMVGAFAAGGVVLGLGPAYIQDTLNGGGAGWGVVFAAIFLGLAAGMFLGLRILRGFSRRRLFGLSIVGAGLVLVLIGLLPSLVAVAILVVALGAFAGMAYVTGYTIVGREVDDDTRGRTFAFLQSGIRVILFLVVVITPLLSTGCTAAISALTGHRNVTVGGLSYAAAGSNAVLLASAGVAIWLGVISYRHMDDRTGVPLRADLVAAIRGRPPEPAPAAASALATATAPDAAPEPALVPGQVPGAGDG
jgi:dTMP kinase